MSITLSNLTTALDKLRDDIRADMQTEISTLRKTIDEQQREITSLKSRVTSLETAAATHTNTSTNTTNMPIVDFRAILDEEKNRETRKANLVFYNIPESTTQHATANTTALSTSSSTNDDNMKIKQIFMKLGLTADIRISKTLRLGRNNASINPKPILVTLSDSKDKFNILRVAKNLRMLPTDDNCKNVYISPDLTKQQQQENKLLRIELLRRRDAGEDVIIRKNKVVLRNI